MRSSRLDQLAQAPILGDDLVVFAQRSVRSDRLFILAQAVAEDCARVLTNGEADSLAAGACVASRAARSGLGLAARHPATREGSTRRTALN